MKIDRWSLGLCEPACCEVNETAEYCRLDYVQLSGNEDRDYCKDIDFPVIKVIHVHNGCLAEEVIKEIEEGYKASLKHKPLFLLDTAKSNYFGGTGQAFDWNLAAEIAAVYPVIVAGGLMPDNVSQLIKTANPWGVDVSSGVESGGIKDMQKVRSFINTVRKTK